MPCRKITTWRCFFYEGGGAPLRTVLRPGCAKKIAIVTGSEGGFSVEEAEAAKAAGAVTVGLGPRILRCETDPPHRPDRRHAADRQPGISGTPYYSSAAARVKQRRTLWTRKKLYTVLKAVFWCVIGAFFGSTIYTCWDYHARPGLYALTSAPWYTSIVMYGILTAIAAAVLLAAMYMVKKKLK